MDLQRVNDVVSAAPADLGIGHLPRRRGASSSARYGTGVLGVDQPGHGKISVMVYLVLAVLLACFLKGSVKTCRRMVGYWRARRTGVEMQAEVVDNLWNPPVGWQKSADGLAQVVRYHLNERSYDAVIVNASGIRKDLGSFMTIVVSPNSPYEPYDRYQRVGAREQGNLLGLVVIVGLLVLALARH